MLWTSSAGDYCRSLLLRHRDVMLASLHGTLDGERATLGLGIERVSDLDIPVGLAHLLHNLFVAVTGDEDPRECNTHLTVEATRTIDQRREHLIEVGVVEDDRRRLPSRLERGPRQPVRSPPHHILCD